MARGTPRRLNKRTIITQETLLVGIQDSDQTHLRQIQTLTQQIDTYQHIIHALAQIRKNLNPFNRIDIGMNIRTTDTRPAKIGIQFFCHTLRQSSDQYSVACLAAAVYLLHEVVHFVIGGTHVNGRVEQSGGSDELLNHDAAALCEFVIAGRGTHIYSVRVREALFPFFKSEGSVVACCGESESVLYEVILACSVAAVHGMYLWDGDVALVHDDEHLAVRCAGLRGVNEIVEQAIGRRAGLSSVEIAAVILYAAAVAYFLNHFQIIFDALLDAFGIEFFALLLKIENLPCEVRLYLLDGGRDSFGRGGEDGGGVDIDGGEFFFIAGGDTRVPSVCRGRDTRVPRGDTVYFGTEELNANDFVGIGESDVHGVTPDAELAACEVCVVADILRADESFEECIHRKVVATCEGKAAGGEVLRAANTIEAADGCDDDDILSAAQECGKCVKSEAVDLLIDGKILLYIGIGRGDVGFGLVVVVIGDEILDGVTGKESLHLGVELCGECFVVTEDECGAVEPCDDVCDGECFAGAGNAQECLRGCALPDTFREAVDSLGLVACGAERAA